jgi:hypothetical protein
MMDRVADDEVTDRSDGHRLSDDIAEPLALLLGEIQK